MVPPPSLVNLLKYGPRFSSLMRFAWVKHAVDRFAEFRFPGPDEAARRTRRTQIWARVTGAHGAARQGFLETPEPYQFTLMTALGAVERVLAGSVPPGAWTPSQAFGSEFVTELGGCSMELESWDDARRNTTVDATVDGRVAPG
jgi:saccharopine dehydrogenase (NAD+, L-lysine-forming)